MKHVKVALKRLVEIRWSAHYNAVKPVSENYDSYIEATEALCDPTENVETRGAAQTLLPPVFTYSLCYLYFWADKEVDQTTQYLQ